MIDYNTIVGQKNKQLFATIESGGGFLNGRI